MKLMKIATYPKKTYHLGKYTILSDKIVIPPQNHISSRDDSSDSIRLLFEPFD